MVMESSEILVHVAAPSTIADDARYRAQVQAILGFQCISHQRISLSDYQQNQYDCTDAGHLPDQSLAATCESTSSSQPPHVIPSYTHTFPSRSASIPTSQNDPPPNGAEKDSLGSPLSVIPDSQPERLSPCHEHFLPPAKRYRVDNPALSPRPHHSSPSTPLLHDKKKSPPLHETEYDDDDNPPPSSTNPSTLKPSPKRIHTTHPPPPCQISLTMLPLEIKPPPPPISTAQFVSHITPTLAMLARRLKTPRYYTPVYQTRDLDTLERGYWHLRFDIRDSEAASSSPPSTFTTRNDSKTWEMALFSRFWSFLSEFIAKEGRAGWGVWCILEEDVDGPPLPQISHRLKLRVYTWGEIASHVYLLLFLASERRIRKMGAQWCDGREETVIQMP
ncbi:hypothetical protein EYZ11_012815 [Aspergillus tanneri]|uniref:Uncharacterized protein n=1 Tax=Aspergillus tanneri TaxID=1220188 RepID=A0A4S3J1E4_9EURO|nr:uncharacterized protein ATNIH1004_004267 [Aspergillus tanneri]KAA8648382.1 hypothetical protein ATNIH1004_004267 [Aspergillus tanneri]THC87738.1 hypothetical protein EYZ11_012815 [Aspergillus tanneri]